MRGREEVQPPPVPEAGTHRSTGEGGRGPERPAQRRGRAPQVCRQGRRGGCRAPAAPPGKRRAAPSGSPGGEGSSASLVPRLPLPGRAALGAGGSRAAALPPPFFPPSPRFLPTAAGGAARGRAGRERREPAAPVAPCSPPPGRGAALPAPRLTSSMAATVFLHWAIRVVKLEAVGDL